MSKCVKDIMSSDVLSVTADQTLNFVEVLAEAKHVRHIPVVEDDSPIAMVSHRDILAHLTKAGVSHFVPVREIMSERVVTVDPGASIEELAKLMRDYDISALPVVDQGKLIGIVTERDFLKLYN